MRIGDLTRRSGVPLPTIRYYLRAGLLPAGVATATNQAEYDERHLHRLGLLFVLLDIGGMSVAGARAVLSAMEDRDVPLRDLLAVVAGAGATSRLRGLGGAEHDVMRAEVSDVLTAHGITSAPGSRPLDRLIDAYAAARRLELTELATALDRYATAAARLVECDVAVSRAVSARIADPASVQEVELREATVVMAVLARVIQEALCDLVRQERLPEAVTSRPGPPPHPSGG